MGTFSRNSPEMLGPFSPELRRENIISKLPQAPSLFFVREEGEGCGDGSTMLKGKAEIRAVTQPREYSAILTLPQEPGYGHFPGFAPLHMCTGSQEHRIGGHLVSTQRCARNLFWGHCPQPWAGRAFWVGPFPSPPVSCTLWPSSPRSLWH